MLQSLRLTATRANTRNALQRVRNKGVAKPVTSVRYYAKKKGRGSKPGRGSGETKEEQPENIVPVEKEEKEPEVPPSEFFSKDDYNLYDKDKSFFEQLPKVSKGSAFVAWMDALREDTTKKEKAGFEPVTDVFEQLRHQMDDPEQTPDVMMDKDHPAWGNRKSDIDESLEKIRGLMKYHPEEFHMFFQDAMQKKIVSTNDPLARSFMAAYDLMYGIRDFDKEQKEVDEAVASGNAKIDEHTGRPYVEDEAFSDQDIIDPDLPADEDPDKKFEDRHLIHDKNKMGDMRDDVQRDMKLAEFGTAQLEAGTNMDIEDPAVVKRELADENPEEAQKLLEDQQWFCDRFFMTGEQAERYGDTIAVKAKYLRLRQRMVQALKAGEEEGKLNLGKFLQVFVTEEDYRDSRAIAERLVDWTNLKAVTEGKLEDKDFEAIVSRARVRAVERETSTDAHTIDTEGRNDLVANEKLIGTYTLDDWMRLFTDANAPDAEVEQTQFERRLSRELHQRDYPTPQGATLDEFDSTMISIADDGAGVLTSDKDIERPSPFRPKIVSGVEVVQQDLSTQMMEYDATYQWKTAYSRAGINNYISLSPDECAKFLPEGIGGDFYKEETEHGAVGMLIRRSTFDLIERLKQYEEGAFVDSKPIILSGDQGVGKSLTLSTLVHWARKNGWIALYVKGYHIMRGDTYIAKNMRFRTEDDESLWDQPIYNVKWLKGLLAAHGDQFRNIRLRTDIDLPNFNGKTVFDLVEYGTVVNLEAGAVCMYLRNELKHCVEYPVLVCFDDVSAIMQHRVSHYGDPDSPSVNPLPLAGYRFTMNYMFHNWYDEHELVYGAMVGARTGRPSSKAWDMLHCRPGAEYEIGSLTRKEADALFDFWHRHKFTSVEIPGRVRDYIRCVCCGSGSEMQRYAKHL